MAFSSNALRPAPEAPRAPPESPEVELIPGFIPPELCELYFSRLRQELSFNPDQIMINGALVSARRQTDYRADPHAAYSYSGVLRPPAPWTPALSELRARVQAQSGLDFNACLCNFYENGEVGMGWHADKEDDLGPRPTIASLSFGQARRFVFRRRLPWREKGAGYQKWEFILQAGDLLYMRGDTQRYFEHALPPAARAQEPRLNFTFRRVIPRP